MLTFHLSVQSPGATPPAYSPKQVAQYSGDIVVGTKVVGMVESLRKPYIEKLTEYQQLADQPVQLILGYMLAY